jgi:hypothetical protein
MSRNLEVGIIIVGRNIRQNDNQARLKIPLSCSFRKVLQLIDAIFNNQDVSQIESLVSAPVREICLDVDATTGIKVPHLIKRFKQRLHFRTADAGDFDGSIQRCAHFPKALESRNHFHSQRALLSKAHPNKLSPHQCHSQSAAGNKQRQAAPLFFRWAIGRSLVSHKLNDPCQLLEKRLFKECHRS